MKKNLEKYLKWFCFFCLSVLSSLSAAQNTVYSCQFNGVTWRFGAAYGYPEYLLYTPAEVTSFLQTELACSARDFGYTHCGCTYTPTTSINNGSILYYGMSATYTNAGNGDMGRRCDVPGSTYSSNYPPSDARISCHPTFPNNWRIRLFGKTDTYPSKTPQNVVGAASRVESYYVLVEKDGAPVANKFVELDMQVTQDSGGHNENSHLQPRPKGAFSRMSGYTDIKGKFTFTWTVPEVSGYYQLGYACATCNNFTAVKAITVGVHELNYFGDDEVTAANGATIYQRTWLTHVMHKNLMDYPVGTG